VHLSKTEVPMMAHRCALLLLASVVTCVDAASKPKPNVRYALATMLSSWLLRPAVLCLWRLPLLLRTCQRARGPHVSPC
jgi:hypothetical protein